MEVVKNMGKTHYFIGKPKESEKDGGKGGNRTHDTRIFSPLLYQLSYLATRFATIYISMTYKRSMRVIRYPRKCFRDAYVTVCLAECPFVRSANTIQYRTHDDQILFTGRRHSATTLRLTAPFGSVATAPFPLPTPS